MMEARSCGEHEACRGKRAGTVDDQSERGLQYIPVQVILYCLDQVVRVAN